MPDDIAASLEAPETPRLLTIAALSRHDAPDCLELALHVLRHHAAIEAADAVLAAAAVVARSRPELLIPDPDVIRSGGDDRHPFDRAVAQSVFWLLSATAQLLEEPCEGELTTMARWLWHDCADHDLMTLADLVALWAEQVVGLTDPKASLVIGLYSRLAEHVRTGVDAKTYATQVLCTISAGDDVMDRLRRAIRADAVAEVGMNVAIGAEPAEDWDPDPLVDQLLVQFASEDEWLAEIGRAQLEELLAGAPTSSLVTGLATTVDELPDHRRSADIEWALVRCYGMPTPAPPFPARFLQRWLDTPLLLDDLVALAALTLLARSAPRRVLRSYLHRAVALSDVRHGAMVAGPLWQCLAAAEPVVVLDLLARWFELGFPAGDLTELVVEVLGDAASDAACSDEGSP